MDQDEIRCPLIGVKNCFHLTFLLTRSENHPLLHKSEPLYQLAVQIML